MDADKQKGEEPVKEQPAAQEDDQDFLSGSKACDLSGEGTCEACQ
ncbi:hypothetical protein [Variovorax sp. dw_954]|nr:hypothetical protein [Variovorax sp. dw_954]